MEAFKDELQTVTGLAKATSKSAATQLQPEHTTSPSQGVEALKDITYGSIAGILGKFVEYPFDTVKVRLQSQTLQHGADRRLQGPWDAFKVAFRSPEGPFASLYRGISAPLLGAAIETSSLFFSYRIAQDLVVSATPSLRALRDQNPNQKIELPVSYLVGCGAASGAFTSLLLTPIELIKCKMQVPRRVPEAGMASKLRYTSRAPGAMELISTIFRTQGLLGLWHGQLGTLIRETGGSAAWFGSYEGVKMLFSRSDPTVSHVKEVKVWQQMIAGAIAGMSYNFVFYPADTIKSRMQTSHAGPSEGQVKAKFLATGKELWREQGLRGFYRGCGITVFRAAPSSAIIFSIYEALRKHFG